MRSLPSLGIKVTAASSAPSPNAPCVPSSFQSRQSLGTSESPNVLKKTDVKPSGPGLLPVGEDFRAIRISSSVMGLSSSFESFSVSLFNPASFKKSSALSFSPLLHPFVSTEYKDEKYCLNSSPISLDENLMSPFLF